MSLLRGGQGVSGWDKCSLYAGISHGLVLSEAAQPEPYAGCEKSDSFFPQPPTHGIPQTITLKLR